MRHATAQRGLTPIVTPFLEPFGPSLQICCKIILYFHLNISSRGA